MDAELGEIEASFAAALRMEQNAYSEDLVEEQERTSSFRDRLVAFRRGPAIRLRTVDGREIRGRVTVVGRDWVRFVESEVPAALGMGAVHELRLEAVLAVEVLR